MKNVSGMCWNCVVSGDNMMNIHFQLNSNRSADTLEFRGGVRAECQHTRSYPT